MGDKDTDTWGLPRQKPYPQPGQSGPPKTPWWQRFTKRKQGGPQQQQQALPEKDGYFGYKQSKPVDPKEKSSGTWSTGINLAPRHLVAPATPRMAAAVNTPATKHLQPSTAAQPSKPEPPISPSAVLPSQEYQAYLRGRQATIGQTQPWGYGDYKPKQPPGRGRPWPPLPGTDAAAQPDQLAQGELGYDQEHPSELKLPAHKGQRAVYGTDPIGRKSHVEAPIQGAADYHLYYHNWQVVGVQHTQDIPWSQPLPDDERAFIESYGFQFGRLLGNGSFGKVWAVTTTQIDAKTGHNLQVACKVMSLKRMIEKGDRPIDAVNRLLNESRIHSQLDHPSIVRCTDVMHIHDQKTGFPYIRCLAFMDLCDGDLRDLLDRQPNKRMNEKEAHHVFKQLAKGVQYLHDHNVAHLDIKIHNVMYVGQVGQVGASSTVPASSGRSIVDQLQFKLADFGLSKQYDPKQTGKVYGRVGTPLYMPPEAKQTPAQWSAAKPMDVYTLGLLLAECLSGKGEMVQMIPELRSWAPDVQRQWGVGKDCADLINHMVHIEPRTRYTISQVLKHPWYLSM